MSAVMLIPFAVILIPQVREKDLCSSLRVNSAKHPCSLPVGAECNRQLQARRGGFAPTSRGSG